MSAPTTDPAISDEIDLGILRAIQLAPRIPFRLLGEVLDRSEQTVARRFRRMQRAGIVRVTAVVSPAALGQSNWEIRAHVRPTGAESLARALAQRDDIGWVSLLSGGSEVVCVVRSRTQQARDELLTQKLPRTTQVLGLTMSVVLHRFKGGGMTDEWAELGRHLTVAQDGTIRRWAQETMSASLGPADVEPGEIVSLTVEDTRLLDALAADGRAPYAALADAAGVGEGRAARRLEALVRSGVVYLDVDLSAAALGFHGSAMLWLTVSPGQLAAAGDAIAALPEVPFVAAVSGSQNLTVSVTCRDLAALYRFVTAGIGPIPGVQALEIAPVLRTVKQAGTLTNGDRLAATAT